MKNAYKGSVYRRGSSWQCEISNMVDGRRIRRTKGGFFSKREAIAFLPNLYEERKQSISFSELWDRFKRTERYRNLSESKLEQWDIAYRRCEQLQRFKSFRDIHYENMQVIVDGLTYYPARDVKVLLNALSTLAMRCDWCEKNYAELIELPSLNAKEKRILTDEEVRRILSVDDSFTIYIKLMLFCGLRPVESRCLMPSDIHLKERYMMGGRKTELGRMSPIGIPAFLVRELESFVPFDGDDKAFLRQFKCVAEKAGVHGVTPVCCRHTFITWLSLDGVPVSVLQKAARHTKYQTTLGYTHINIDDVLGAVDNLSRKVPFNML